MLVMILERGETRVERLVEVDKGEGRERSEVDIRSRVAKVSERSAG